ncbi:MAG: hypothetical protein HC772_12960 [Leptolyngbyaceae cyanobacterium CRU_2_3]|nr:hypothetical protein [Leptolyngbyaceae cyanobacterium CRU_2_3]
MAFLEGLGSFHNFHTQNLDPDESRCCNDDSYTSYISFPNYHSGRNGDYQAVIPVEPIHDLLKTHNGRIAYFPAHPHEGSVAVPVGVDYARVVATGKSLVTGRSFNLAIAADPPQDVTGAFPGRVVAQSTFHHLVDYNWDISKGCPTFVDEPPGDDTIHHPERLEDIKAYVRNLVLWLAPGQA